MHFWNIEHVKQELAFGRHDEAMTIRYFFAVLAFEFFLSFFAPYEITAPNTRFWGYVATVGGAFVILAGTYYAFRRNGGWAGRDFFIRFFPILWIVGVRVAVLGFLPVLIVVWMIGMVRGVNPDDIRSVQYLAASIVHVFMYWRIGKHMHDIATTIKAVQ